MNLSAATVEQTRSLGSALGAVLRPGDVVILAGDLGAGKTALTQGLAVGLGVQGEVTSPTFVIARVHRPDPERGRGVSLVHVDAYRLGDSLELDELDLDTELAAYSATVVEWGVGKAEQLSDSRLEVEIAVDPDTERRDLRFVPVGGDWDERLETVRTAYCTVVGAAAG